jgi:cell division protein FtsA
VFAARNDAAGGLLLLDLGSHQARAVALVPEGSELVLRGAASVPFGAAPDGVLVALDLARTQLEELLGTCGQRAGLGVRRVLASIGGTHLRLVQARGSIALRLPVVLRRAHLERVLDAATAIELPSDQEVLHVLPTSYEVDGARTHEPPLGIRARRLLAEAALVTVSRLALDTLERVLAELGYELVDVAAEPLVTAGAVLSADDRQRGAVLVDLGAERITAVVYRHRVVQGLHVLGAGAVHASRDLAFALRLELGRAEEIKRRYGVARVAEADPEVETLLEHEGRTVRVGQPALAAVLEPRMRELLALVRQGLGSALAPGDRVVLCGGGARLRGLVELAEDVFAAPARMGASRVGGDLEAETSCTALGLAVYAERCGLERRARSPAWSGAVRRLGRAFGMGALRPPAAAARPVAAAGRGESRPRRVFVPPRVGVDLEVGDVRVRTRV